MWKTSAPGTNMPGERVRIEGGIKWAFGDRFVARRRDKPRELRIGDGAFIHPEAVDANQPGRTLLRIMYVRPHLKCSASDPAHAFGERQ